MDPSNKLPSFTTSNDERYFITEDVAKILTGLVGVTTISVFSSSNKDAKMSVRVQPFKNISSDDENIHEYFWWNGKKLAISITAKV